MTLVYRTMFASDRETDLHAVVRSSFEHWLGDRGIPVVGGDVEGSTAPADHDVSMIAAEDGDLRASRLLLSEPGRGGRWTTTAIVVTDGDEQVAWIDLEHSSDDPLGPAPDVTPPALVGAVLSSCRCRASETQLRPEPWSASASDVPALIGDLLDPDRVVPIVVLSKDRYASAEVGLERARQVHKRLVGLAGIVVLDQGATDGLAEQLGPDLKVVGGAVKAYLPGLTLDEAIPKRHPAVAGTVFGSQPAASALRLQRALTPTAIARQPPMVYRDRVLHLPGFSRASASADHDEELLAESIALEAERDALTARVAEVQHELEFSTLQLEETEAELDGAQARVRYLEARLRAAGDAAANQPTPLAAVPDSAESCVDAIGLAMQYLSRVEIGDTEYAAQNLDTYMKSTIWGRKAWRVFRAMEDYAELKQDGEFDGDFLAYCDQSPMGRTIIPAGWVAMKESESTDTNSKYRSARTFPVPAEVSDDEMAYMCAHVKLEAGGRPAPRIHFFDDTAGTTGMVYVGYFGEHLPNDGTN